MGEPAVEIALADSVSVHDCARLMLASEPWKSLGYGPDDAAALAAASQRARTLVARMNGEVVGFTISTSGFLAGEYLRLLVVDARHRRLGVGRRLMERLEEEVFAASRNLYLCVSDFNTSARDFYRSLGYGEIGSVPDLLVAGSAEILMRKTTGPSRAAEPGPKKEPGP
jgi:ribosomal protein S18 acetylase RimI-like enzyme